MKSESLWFPTGLFIDTVNFGKIFIVHVQKSHSMVYFQRSFSMPSTTPVFLRSKEKHYTSTVSLSLD